MKIIIPRNSMGTQFLDKDDQPIKDIAARSVTVHAAVGEPAKAEIELAFIEESRIEVNRLVYRVGTHRNVVALVLADGTTVELPEAR